MLPLNVECIWNSDQMFGGQVKMINVLVCLIPLNHQESFAYGGQTVIFVVSLLMIFLNLGGMAAIDVCNQVIIILEGENGTKTLINWLWDFILQSSRIRLIILVLSND